MKILTTFYSRSGTTKKIGEQIADELKCDIEEFFDTQKRSGIIGWLKCGYQATRKKLTVLKPIEKNLNDYDLVIIGTPIWNGNVSVPSRTYVIENASKFKSVAFYCTAGGSDGEKAFANMENSCNKKPVAVLGITKKDIKNEMHLEKIKNFIAKIQ
jgi:flavodoxin